MRKTVLFIFIIFQSFISLAVTPPNEKKIYFHIHQATRWAELMYSKKCIFSKREIIKHLGEIKFSQVRLVDSKFYKNYIFLSKIVFETTKSNFNQIEIFREEIHTKAEKLKIEHPVNWQNEFLVCSSKI